jgi:hypothetical protein
MGMVADGRAGAANADEVAQTAEPMPRATAEAATAMARREVRRLASVCMITFPSELRETRDLLPGGRPSCYQDAS